MIGHIFQKELILIRQMHQKNVMLFIIDILKVLVLNMNHIFAMFAMI